MLPQIILARSVARRRLDRLANAFYKVIRKPTFVIHGIKMPYSLPVNRLNLWHEDFERELRRNQRENEARYLAHIVQRKDVCWVIFEPRYFANVIALLMQFAHKGVRARVFIAPGDPDPRVEGARRLPSMSFLREIMPLHSYELMSETGMHEVCRSIESGGASCRSAFLYTDIPGICTELTSGKGLESVMLHCRLFGAGKKSVRKLLKNISRDGYFIDGRVSGEHQLLARKYSGRNSY